MPDYRRNRIAGGCYFFTDNLLEHYQNQLLVQQIDILRDVVRRVRVHHPFHIWIIFIIIRSNMVMLLRQLIGRILPSGIMSNVGYMQKIGE